jgi:8-oxo-dGTP diphosphatase
MRVVVGAAILDGPRLLAARRVEPPELAGGWELPGGKVEPGELGVLVRLRDRVGPDWPMTGDAALRVWTATVVEGSPTALADHSEVRWLDPGHWLDVAWLPLDQPVIEHLERTLQAD